jgi:hypothetical protein
MTIMSEQESPRQTAMDHELWMRCYVSALTGSPMALAAGTGSIDAAGLARIAAAIADAAVNHVMDRRGPGAGTVALTA